MCVGRYPVYIYIYVRVYETLAHFSQKYVRIVGMKAPVAGTSLFVKQYNMVHKRKKKKRRAFFYDDMAWVDQSRYIMTHADMYVVVHNLYG